MRLECYITGTTVVIVVEVQPAVMQVDKRLRGYAFNERKYHSLCVVVLVYVVDIGVANGGSCGERSTNQRMCEFMWLTWVGSREEPVAKDQPVSGRVSSCS